VDRPTFSYLTSLVYDELPYRVKQGAGDRGIIAENMERLQHIQHAFGAAIEDDSIEVSSCDRTRVARLPSRIDCLMMTRSSVSIQRLSDGRTDRQTDRHRTRMHIAQFPSH